MALYRRANPTTSAAKFFDIRLDQDVVLLRGEPDEANSVSIKGTVVLCLLEPLSLKKIKLVAKGTCRLAWYSDGTTLIKAWRRYKYVDDFWIQEWTLFDLTGQKQSVLEPGNYEFPFEIIFGADAAESVEGLPDSWIVYRLKATIERGRLAHNVHAHKHLRIVRTLAMDALEPATSSYLEGEWPEKVKYSVGTTSKAVVLGTPVHFQIRMVPLMKGLTIEDIFVAISEVQIFNLTLVSQKIKRHVASLNLRAHDAVDAISDEGEDMWLVEESLQLPTSLLDCVQDVDRMGLTVTHHLKVFVNLRNPDGHVSIVRVRLPILIYISPNVVLNDQNEITNSSALSQMTPEHLDLSMAPPVYGEHRRDQPWRDIDPSGFMTPMDSSSEATTPDDGRSRSVSSENLEHLGLAAVNPSAHGSLPAGVLRHRLSNLPDANASRRPIHIRGSSAPAESAASRSSPQSGRTSEEASTQPSEARSRSSGYFASRDTPATPLTGPESSGSRRGSGQEGGIEGRHYPESPSEEHIEFDQETLSKVPSYQTAMRAPAGTPVNRDLPTYDTATGTSLPRPVGPFQDSSRRPFRLSLGRSLPR